MSTWDSKAKIIDFKPIRKYIDELYNEVLVYEGILIDDIGSKFKLTVYETLVDPLLEGETTHSEFTMDVHPISLKSSLPEPVVLFLSSYTTFVKAYMY